MDATTRLHYVHIKAMSDPYTVVDSISWRDLPFHVRIKWNWYFRYRSALMQVKHPRSKVEMNWGNYEPEGDRKLRMLRNRIIAKKRKISEINNKLQQARDNWNQLFPIEDDNLYQKAIEKLNRIKFEKLTLETELSELKSHQPATA